MSAIDNAQMSVDTYSLLEKTLTAFEKGEIAPKDRAEEVELAKLLLRIAETDISDRKHLSLPITQRQWDILARAREQIPKLR